MKPLLDDEKHTFLRAMHRFMAGHHRVPADWPASFWLGVLLGILLMAVFLLAGW